MSWFLAPRRSRRALIAGGVLFGFAGTILASVLLPSPLQAAPAKKRLLFVTVTKGFRHDCIPVSEEVIKSIADKSGAFTVDYVRNDAEMAEKMSPLSLNNYDAVFFANTTGDLPLPDRDAFLKWIADGHGFIGAHAATDTFHGYRPYIAMIGAEFKTHGPQVEVECLVEDKKHPSTRHLGGSQRVFDEIYLFQNYDPSRFHKLLSLDKHPNEGTPGYYPIAWSRREGKGRVFYTALGHRQDVWNAPWYQRHLLGGIRWALGLEKGDAKPQVPLSKVSAAEKRQGFRSLFNGRDLTGWHLRNPNGKPSWSVQNGMLVNTVAPGDHGTDLVSDEKFGDHIVRYEYMIPKGSNSGFYLRGRYEVQIMDDGDNKNPGVHNNGAIYGKIAPSTQASRPVGQWQQVEATLIGNRVTLVLNGTKIIDNQPIEGVTGAALDDRVNEPGPILLQGDHGSVAFRNIRVKPLRSTVSPSTGAAR